MDIHIILLILAIAAGIFFLRKTKPFILKASLICLLICVSLSFSSHAYLLDSSQFAIGIVTIILTVYSFLKKLPLLLIISSLIALGMLSDFFFYDISEYVKMTLFLPAVLLVISLRLKKVDKSLIGLLAILSIIGINEFVRLMF